MMLLILLALAAIPLVGIGWILLYGSVTSVDGLFMSLILLTMSGILGTTALFELRQKLTGAPAGPRASGSGGLGGLIRRGKIQEVQFYESNVGQPNNSIVMLSSDGNSSQMLVLEGDVRNALPVGQRVEITMRKQGAQNVIANVSYL